MVMIIGFDIAIPYVDNLEYTVTAIIMSVVFGIMGIFIIVAFYTICKKPSSNDENSDNPFLEYEIAETKKRKPGRNMYEVVDLYRLSYFRKNVIMIFVCAPLLIILLKLWSSGFMHIKMPLCFYIIMLVVYLIVSSVSTYKHEFVFITSEDLKNEILNKEFDEQSVNDDFMKATYHKMFKGMMAIGSEYYVVFMKKFCHIGDISEILAIETFTEIIISQGDVFIKRPYISIFEDYEDVQPLLCEDENARELIIREFKKFDIDVKDTGEFIFQNEEPNDNSAYEFYRDWERDKTCH